MAARSWGSQAIFFNPLRKHISVWLKGKLVIIVLLIEIVISSSDARLSSKEETMQRTAAKTFPHQTSG